MKKLKRSMLALLLIVVIGCEPKLEPTAPSSTPADRGTAEKPQIEEKLKVPPRLDVTDRIAQIQKRRDDIAYLIGIKREVARLSGQEILKDIATGKESKSMTDSLRRQIDSLTQEAEQLARILQQFDEGLKSLPKPEDQAMASAVERLEQRLREIDSAPKAIR